jgi:hypothetical protein
MKSAVRGKLFVLRSEACKDWPPGQIIPVIYAFLIGVLVGRLLKRKLEGV